MCKSLNEYLSIILPNSTRPEQTVIFPLENGINVPITLPSGRCIETKVFYFIMMWPRSVRQMYISRRMSKFTTMTKTLF